MSHTDAHAPFWVRLARAELAVEPWHPADHTTCDLPAHPPIAPDRPPTTKCHWSFHYTGVNICCCAMCHDGATNRRDNRRRRHRDRTDLSAALKRWNQGDQSAFDLITS